MSLQTAGRARRVEVKGLNTKALGGGKRVEKGGEQRGCRPGLRERFLAGRQAAPVSFLEEGPLERWAEPSPRGNRRWAGLDLNKARNRSVIAAVRGWATAPEGFTVAELAHAVRGRAGWSETEYPFRRAAYDWAKLRGKGLVERVQGRRRYPLPARAIARVVRLRGVARTGHQAGLGGDRPQGMSRAAPTLKPAGCPRHRLAGRVPTHL